MSDPARCVAEADRGMMLMVDANVRRRINLRNIGFMVNGLIIFS